MHSTEELNEILGAPLDWPGATSPERAALPGRTVRLEPLDIARHAAALYEAAHGEGADPHLWDFMPYTPFDSLEAYSTWLDQHAVGADPLFFALVPLIGAGQGQAQGTAALMRITPEHGTVEIGHVWYGAALQKTRSATEAIYLLLRAAFDHGFRRVEWKCHASNAGSRRAALRLGFNYEGVFRAHMVVKNRNRDTAWFSMLDSEWPRQRAAFEAWLGEANFDAQGNQRQSLDDFRRDL